jgi:hypothetical protein
MAFEHNPNEARGIDRQIGLTGKLAMLSVASLLCVAISATDAPAASSPGTVHGLARLHKGTVGPVYNQAPSMPPPVLNPSTPNTAPTTPEVPVSPASPGSVFGNGP